MNEHIQSASFKVPKIQETFLPIFSLSFINCIIDLKQVLLPLLLLSIATAATTATTTTTTTTATTATAATVLTTLCV